MNSMPNVFPLLPTIQSYDWGKRGSESKVAQLAAASNIPGFKFDERTPYAEVSVDYRCCFLRCKHRYSFGWEHIRLRHLKYSHLHPMPHCQNTLLLIASSLAKVSSIGLNCQMETSHFCSKFCRLEKRLVFSHILTKKWLRGCMLSIPKYTRVCISLEPNIVFEYTDLTLQTLIISQKWLWH